MKINNYLIIYDDILFYTEIQYYLLYIAYTVKEIINIPY